MNFCLLKKNLIFHLRQRRQLIESGRPTLIFASGGIWRLINSSVSRVVQSGRFFLPKMRDAYANAGIMATRYLDDGQIQFLGSSGLINYFHLVYSLNEIVLNSNENSNAN